MSRAHRVRVRYAKAGKLRFVSAIDLTRIWERSLRRADLPIAYSEGFSPHPKLSFPDALPLGYDSTGEYAELTFAAPVAVDDMREALNEALPEGMAVLAAVSVRPGAPKLAKALRAGLWRLGYPDACVGEVARAVATVREATAVIVDRDRKGETTQIDIRPALDQLTCAGGTVAAVVHNVQPPVRPSELHAALAGAGGAPTGEWPELLLACRVAQGAPDAHGLREALTGTPVPLIDSNSRRQTRDSGQQRPRQQRPRARQPDENPIT